MMLHNLNLIRTERAKYIGDWCHAHCKFFQRRGKCFRRWAAAQQSQNNNYLFFEISDPFQNSSKLSLTSWESLFGIISDAANAPEMSNSPGMFLSISYEKLSSLWHYTIFCFACQHLSLFAAHIYNVDGESFFQRGFFNVFAN